MEESKASMKQYLYETDTKQRWNDLKDTKRRIWINGSIIFIMMLLFLGYQVKHEITKSSFGLLYQMNQQIARTAEQQCFPALYYFNETENKTLNQWLLSQVAYWFPAAEYWGGMKKYEVQNEDGDTMKKILASQANEEPYIDENGNLIGETEAVESVVPATKTPTLDVSIEKLRDFEYLLSNFYIVDSSTMVYESDLNAEELLSKNMKIDLSTGGPKVLIFHTHSQEGFADSVPGDTSMTIVGMGEYLAQLLNEKGIPTMHDSGVYDVINGKLDRSNAYEYSEEAVLQILEANPTIEVVIDLHRDGVAEGTKLVTEIDGKQTAQVMFFNGLSRTRTNGDLEYLPNPYIQDNLAFSLQMKLACEELYSGFARKTYLRGYRYSLHMKPKSLLIEAGAQTNTVEEMKCAMVVLAEVLNQVIKEEK